MSKLLRLPGVTLLAATSVEIGKTIEALQVSADKIEFGAVKLLTSDPPRLAPSGIEVVPIASMDIYGYSRFMLGQLHRHFDTPHCLIVQADGYVLNPGQWRQDFLLYDYIGAPWAPAVWIDALGQDLHLTHNRVGNGGFSLRSRRLMQVASLIDFDSLRLPTRSEDIILCHYHYQELTRQGMRFAPLELAETFATERPEAIGGRPIGSVFGFHGKYRLAEACEWLRYASSLAAAGDRPGRNAPCACGSGRKFKHCHGRQA